MAENTWVVDQGKIAIRIESSGKLFFPTAGDVYSCEFADLKAIEGFELPVRRPSSDLSTLAISRFPVDVRIVLAGNQLDNVTANIIGVTPEERQIAIPQELDQVISDGTWWPIEINRVTGALDWLKRHGVEVDSPLSLRTLFELRLDRSAPVKIIDRTTISSMDLAGPPASPDLSLKGLNARLYPYQQQGISFLTNIAEAGLGCLLGDEMGLGKTLQVIGLITSEHEAGRGPALVVMPATLVENWRRELLKFSPGLRVFAHVGGNRPGISHYFDLCDVVLTSYETAVRDVNLLSDVTWNLLVIDEAQSIKNPDAIRTQTLKCIPRRVSVAVTGTPVENSLTDLWSISDFSLPGLLGSKSEFQAEFPDALASARELGSIVEPIILRRKVLDVATDLPELIEIPQAISMAPAQAAQYEQFRLQAIEERGALASLTLLRRYCTDPSLVNDRTRPAASPSMKLIRVIEILEEIAAVHEKALVFSSFTGMLDLLRLTLEERWPHAHLTIIDGRTPISDRQRAVDRFSAHQGFGLLLLNPQAAGTGLNITSANHVIHYNPEWNPAKTDQASRRAYRRGQELPVTVHHIFYADTLEEWVVAKSMDKRDLADAAVQGHDGTSTASAVLEALRLSPVHQNGARD